MSEQLQWFNQEFMEANKRTGEMLGCFQALLLRAPNNAVEAAFAASHVAQAGREFDEAIELRKNQLGIRDRRSRTEEFEVLVLCPPGVMPSPEQIQKIISHYYQTKKGKK